MSNKAQVAPVPLDPTAKERARKIVCLPSINSGASLLGFEEWKQKLEQMIEEGRPIEVVESWIHHAFTRDRSRYLLALYLLELAESIRIFESIRHRIYKKVVQALIRDFFGDDRVDPYKQGCLEALLDSGVLFPLIWQFLAESGTLFSVHHTLSSTFNKNDKERVNHFVKRLYGAVVKHRNDQTYAPDDVRVRRRIFINESCPDIVRTLANLDLLELVIGYRDTRPDMIMALEEYALREGALDEVQKKNPTLRDVVAFGYSHQLNARRAAGYAIILRMIAQERRELAAKKQRELERLR